MGKRKIIIIQDEAVLPDRLEDILKDLDYSVLEIFVSVEEALPKVGRLKPDIILVDSIEGEEIQCLESAHHLEKETQIPVIAMISSPGEKKLMDNNIDSPCDYLLKPVNKRELTVIFHYTFYKLRCLSQRKRLEEEKERMKTQLLQTQLSQATMNLAGGIAHNFNNALVSISGNVGMLDRKYRDDEKIARHIKPMKSSVQKMVLLTNQLLAYARGGKWRSKIISLQHFTEITLRLLKYSIGSDISIEIDFPPETLNVEVDEAQMQMVLLAILNNAREAVTGKGKIRILLKKIELQNTRIEGSRKLPPGTYACLTIHDNGKGMTPEVREKIFQPFFSTKGGGRGLGMAAANGIMGNHNGWISVESQPGKGTGINVYLPVADAPVTEIEEPQVDDFVEIPGTGTILMVEDEAEVIEFTLGILKKLGYHVILAKTGNEAVKIVNSFNGEIDAVLLDVILPDMLGTEVYHLIKEIRPGLKVLVCSGYNMDGPVQEIIKAGALDFIPKPFTINLLSKKLQKAIKGNN